MKFSGKQNHRNDDLTIVAIKVKHGRSSEVDRQPTGTSFALIFPAQCNSFMFWIPLSLKFSERWGFDAESREQVNLAVIEAGTNAIKHGNKEDVNKRAHFEFVLNQDKLTVVVKMAAAGFDRKSVENPLDPENLLKSSGRGIFLMGNLYGRSYLRRARDNSTDGEVQETVKQQTDITLSWVRRKNCLSDYMLQWSQLCFRRRDNAGSCAQL